MQLQPRTTDKLRPVIKNKNQIPMKRLSIVKMILLSLLAISVFLTLKNCKQAIREGLDDGRATRQQDSLQRNR